MTFTSQRGFMERYWPELITATLFILGYGVLWNVSFSHDAVWQLWIARQLNGGSTLYSQILEVNPPLWFWMAMPVDRLANVLSVAPSQVLVAAIFGLIGLSLTAIAALINERSEKSRMLILMAACVTLIIVPLESFAQREQLCLIGALPYALLLSRRAEGKRVPWQLGIVIGLLAAPFFALKHYFAVIPILLELWLIFELRRSWRPIRPETIVLGLAAVVYGIAIIVITPDYLQVMVPLLRSAYGNFYGSFVAFPQNITLPIVILGAMFFWNQRHSISPQAKSLVITTLAFLFIYLIQKKGWGYQASPVIGAAVFATLVQIAAHPNLAVPKKIQLVLVTTIIAIAVVPPLLVGSYVNKNTLLTERLLKDVQPGMTAVMLTKNPTRIWPAVEHKGLKWPSRYFSFWMMYSFANTLYATGNLGPQLTEFANSVRTQTVEDFTCNPPDILIVDSGSFSVSPQIDMLGFFLEDPQFAALFSAYEKTETVETLDAYRKIKALPQLPDVKCRTIY